MLVFAWVYVFEMKRSPQEFATACNMVAQQIGMESGPSSEPWLGWRGPQVLSPDPGLAEAACMYLQDFGVALRSFRPDQPDVHLYFDSFCPRHVIVDAAYADVFYEAISRIPCRLKVRPKRLGCFAAYALYPIF